MAKSRRSNRKINRRGKTRRQRGGGGCFGGLCKPNKAKNMKVEQPGVLPANMVVQENPMRMGKNTSYENAMEAGRKALAAAYGLPPNATMNQIQKAEKKVSNIFSRSLGPEITNAELEEFARAQGINLSSSGTGLQPGSEVNLNTMTNEQAMAELEALEAEFQAEQATTKKRKTRKNHRGGGGCFGGICKPNKQKNMKVEQPGVPPKSQTMIENPLQTLQATKNRLETSLQKAYPILQGLKIEINVLKNRIASLETEKQAAESRGNTKSVERIEKRLVDKRTDLQAKYESANIYLSIVRRAKQGLTNLEATELQLAVNSATTSMQRKNTRRSNRR
jgi:hypothetical protein